MASFSVNPIGSYANWPEHRQKDGDRKKPRSEQATRSPDDVEPDEQKPRAADDGPVGTEIDIEV
jgi:hypothetical protein